MRYNGLFAAAAAIGALLSSATLVQAWNEEPLGEINIVDPHLKAWVAITPENPPDRPVPGTDYGMDAATGTFKHPTATPLNDDAPAFPGQLEGWDQNTYVKNVNEIAFSRMSPRLGMLGSMSPISTASAISTPMTATICACWTSPIRPRR